MRVRKTIVAALLSFLFLAGIALWWFWPPLWYWVPGRQPLGQATAIDFPSDVPQAIKVESLKGDFRIITDVRALPAPVFKSLQEEGGSRSVMANPGGRFESTDAIFDSSVPRQRLILAGVSRDLCFVHYEQGGFAYNRPIKVFRLRSATTMEPLWRGYCNEPSTTLEILRSRIASGECN